MKKFFYNNITPRTHVSTTCSSAMRERFNGFNNDDSEYMSLEDKIILATESGADIGARISPQFDDPDVDELDITCSLRHDAMDIAEEFGKMPDTPSSPPSTADTNE